MRISDWSSDVCSSDLCSACASHPTQPRPNLCPTRCSAIRYSARKGPLEGPDDVPTFAHCPEDLLGLRTQGPARSPRLLCQSQLGQVLQAAKQERTVPASTQVPRDAVQIDHAIDRKSTRLN